MIEQLIGPITGLLDKFIEDKDQKALLAHEVATMAQRHAQELTIAQISQTHPCLLYTSPSPRDGLLSRMPSSA